MVFRTAIDNSIFIEPLFIAFSLSIVNLVILLLVVWCCSCRRWKYLSKSDDISYTHVNLNTLNLERFFNSGKDRGWKRVPVVKQTRPPVTDDSQKSTKKKANLLELKKKLAGESAEKTTTADASKKSSKSAGNP